MKQQALSMTEGIPWKSILRFALPLMVANVLQQLYNTVDTIVVGNFDSQVALSAVGSCAYLTGFYLAIALGFSLGASVLISQFFGAHEEDTMKKYAGTSIVLLMIIGIITTVFAFLTNGIWLTHIINVPANILDMAMNYITIYTIGLIFQFGYNIVAAILRAVGDSKSSLYFLCVAALFNVILDILFVVVFHWGVVGVAVATTISQAISMVISFIYMFKKFPVFCPNKRYWRLNAEISKHILVTGAPMTVQQIIINCGFMLLQRLVNSFGEVLTASYTVACRLECYMLVPINALGSTMATYAGQNYGANEIQRIKKGNMQSILMGLIIAIIIGGLCFVFAQNLVELFGLSGQSATYSLSHVRLVCFDILLYALYQPLVGLYQGIGKGTISMFMFGIELAGRIIFAYLLSGVIGPACVWWGEPFAFIVVIIYAFTYYKLGRWQKKETTFIVKNI